MTAELVLNVVQNAFLSINSTEVIILHSNRGNTVRKYFTFKGRVQGVGFCITFYQQAIRLHLTDWVRNLSNGDVEICVQGEWTLIQQVISHMQSIRYIHIDHCDMENLRF